MKTFNYNEDQLQSIRELIANNQGPDEKRKYRETFASQYKVTHNPAMFDGRHHDPAADIFLAREEPKSRNDVHKRAKSVLDPPPKLPALNRPQLFKLDETITLERKQSEMVIPSQVKTN